MSRAPDPFERLVPISDRYATLPIPAAFNWDDCAPQVASADWYLVAFRSTVRPTADLDLLRDADDRAHEESRSSPGFIHYFKGPLTDRLECLSFCVWETRAFARAAAARPHHAAAVGLTQATYERYVLEFHALRKRARSRSFEFEPYDAPGADPALPAVALTPLLRPAD